MTIVNKGMTWLVNVYDFVDISDSLEPEFKTTIVTGQLKSLPDSIILRLASFFVITPQQDFENGFACDRREGGIMDP